MNAEEPEAYVVDASVAAKWHLPDEQDTDKALELLRQFIEGHLPQVVWIGDYTPEG